MLLKRLYFIGCLSALLPHGRLSAQSNTNTMPTITSFLPVSPNAAALGKFGEIPVSYYTGIPSVSVPIYEINTGGLKLPVSIDYHAGGVKIEDIASWVGTGWALNAGGVITRQVRGLPDETAGGYLFTYDSITSYINGTMSQTSQTTYYTNVVAGLEDSQQDIFFYNFGGAAGRFLFDSSGSTVVIPASRYKIEFGTFLGQDQVFKITDLEGNQYFFTNKENSTYTLTNGSLSANGFSATSSWYLTQVENALGTDSILLSYERYNNTTQSIGSQANYVFNTVNEDGNCQGTHTDIATVNNSTNSLRLKAITFKNGRIDFIANPAPRCDLTSDHALSTIVIHNTDGSFYKKYTFDQSYYSAQPNACDTMQPANNRLFLDSLSFSDSLNELGAYRFSYLQRSQLPNRMSYAQDFWGYYNGASNNSTMVPSTILLNSIYGKVFTTAGANRNSVFSLAESGVLDTISYPTGGKTAFEYEANTAGNLLGNEDFVVGTGHFFVFPTGDTTRQIDTTFTLSDDYANAGGVNMSWLINPGNGCSGSQQIGCPLTTLSYAGGSIGPINSNASAFVAKGPVRVTVDFRSVTDTTIIHNYTFGLSWGIGALSVDSLKHNIPVGGLRVKAITDYTATGAVASVKRYTYNDPDSTNYSSGSLLSFPSYVGSLIIMQRVLLDPDNLLFRNFPCFYTSVSSSPNGTLIADQSAYTTYKYVQEILGQNGEFGKNVYQFTAADQYPDIVPSGFPFPPGMSVDWERGKLVHEMNYRYNPSTGAYDLMKEVVNSYQPIVTSEYSNLKIGQSTIYTYPNITPLNTDFGIGQFNTEAGWFPLMSDTTRLYDQNNLSAFAQTVHSYVYSNTHFQPVTITTINSKGEQSITQNKYPLDYTGLTGTDHFTTGILNLQNRNIVAPVIEKYVQLQNPDGTNSRVVNGLITSYRADKPLPDTVWATELSSPATGFVPTTVSGGQIIRSGLYQPQVEFLRYDPVGNIVEQRKKVDAKRAYIWDYLATFPIAEAINADSSSIAYTSFEADGTGNWTIPDTTRNRTDHVTGNCSYNLNGTISRSGLNSAATYIVSYWSKNGALNVNGTSATAGTVVGAWTYYEHSVSGASSISVSGTATVDELRLFPKGALMTTYTYSPLAGMTSQCTPTNYITYYSYDGLGRLKVVKDLRGNIVKTVDYHYQQQ